ncbi:hypothetical protein MHH60_14165 [Paenibacillus sp. FSL H7-0716]|uniref:hypothetical protein n=1 Tax=unclassified Paenibacillus TaxID=185978 RepID=UPI002115D99C|nr:hypothetical protein [Paenibacillus odorifer]
MGRTTIHLANVLQVSHTCERSDLRMNKEIRKHLKPMNSLTNMDAAEKIVYHDVMDYNERFSERVIRGFGDPEVKKKLNEMFVARYSV